MQDIVFNSKAYKVIKEGVSSILIPATGEVFYNPVQEFNRDLSVAVIRTFSTYVHRRPERGLRILDALTASGFRAIRYAHQIPNVSSIYANDLSESARETVSNNVEYNNIKENVVHVNIDDASAFMYSMRNRKDKFDVIDVDPYGSASEFLDAAVQAIEDGGLLCITCTDMAVLCGVHPGTCFAKYGGVPHHVHYSQEEAVRLILSAIETSANKYSRYIEPLLSANIDFYSRVFVRVHKSPKEVKTAFGRKALVFSCNHCKAFYLRSLDAKTAKSAFSMDNCEQCGSRLQIGGPMWSGDLHSEQFLTHLQETIRTSVDDPTFRLGTIKRLEGFTALLLEELQAPLYMSLSHMAKLFHCTMPPLAAIKSAILNAGHKVSVSHCDPLGLKTDGPLSVLWDIMKHWIVTNPLSEKTLKSLTDVEKHMILSPPKQTISFEPHPDAQKKSQGLVRFFVPPPNWGPLPKAKKAKSDQ